MSFTQNPHVPGHIPSLTGKGLCIKGTHQCLNLKGDVFQTGNPIDHYGWDATEERFRWNLAEKRS